MTKQDMKIVREESGREIHPNDVLLHPLNHDANAKARARYKYTFLRVTRWPTPDRPDSGRILVENHQTGNRTEHYALLFNARFK